MPDDPKLEADTRTVSYDRFKEINEKLKEAQGRIRELEATTATSAKSQAEFDVLKAKHAALDARYTQDAAMFALASTAPDLGDAEVRDFIRSVYDAKQGEKPAFGEWLAEQQKTPSRLLKPYLSAPVAAADAAATSAQDAASAFAAGEMPGTVAAPAVAPGAPASAPARPGNPNAGAVAAKAARPAFTRGDIAAMSAEQYRAHRGEVQAAYKNGTIAP